MQFGRQQIFTNAQTITYKNVINVLQDAMIVHLQNANDIERLIKIESGDLIWDRTKTYRADIDHKYASGIPHQATEFKRGFHWGNPITLIQNGNGEDKDLIDAIAELNDCFDADNSKVKNQTIGRFVEICGVCNEYIDLNDEYEDGDSYFTTTPLDPRTSFVVYSNYYVDKRPMMGVTYRYDSLEQKYFFTCITKDFRFEIVNASKITNGTKVEREESWGHDMRSGEKNPFGIINIVEWIRDDDRMGCFERAVPAIREMAYAISDFNNDVDQNTQSIWFSVDLDLGKDEDGNEIQSFHSGDLIRAYSSESGKPSLQPISVGYDYSGMLEHITSMRSTILEELYIPARSDNSGGSTGLAMDGATGFSTAELVAQKQQPFQERAKMQEVKVALAVIKKSHRVPADSKMLSLKLKNIQPNIQRPKTFELTVKVNAISTLLSHGFELSDAVKAIPMFPDNNEVCANSGASVKKYQEANVFKTAQQSNGGYDTEAEPDKGRTLQDLSDQIENSPNIDGTSTGKKVEEEK